MRLLGSIITAVLAPAGIAVAEAGTEFREKIEPLLQDYCYDCHGDGAQKGDVSLDEFKDLSSHLENHELWLRVWKNLRSELMPPAEEEFQPTAEERFDALTGLLDERGLTYELQTFPNQLQAMVLRDTRSWRMHAQLSDTRGRPCVVDHRRVSR